MSGNQLDDRTIVSDIFSVNGKQFIRRARKWANSRGLVMTVDAKRGKGGHQIATIDAKWTTVKTGEIGVGLLSAMLEQLGIPKDEF
jgi:hypothetical protein